MLDVRLFQMQTFLPMPYEDALAPRLKLAHEKLQNGSGIGGDFTGWVHLPRDYDKEEFARIKAAAARIQGNSKALVVIGIGGSYLGARGVIECLCSPNYNLKKKDTPNIYFVGNGLSSDSMQEVVDLLGDDDFGRFLLKTLEDNGVRPCIRELTGEATTTMAFVSLDENNDRSFTFARKPGADMMLDKSEIKDEDLKTCRIIQAGSCSLSAGKAVEATEYAMARAHELGKMVGFDINYRNLMWNDDREACTKEVLSILKYVDFLKLSEEEIDMVGGHDNILNIMKEYDIAVAVLTLGGGGAELFYDGQSYVVPGYHVEKVADTTGAGDAFWGGFLACVLNHGVSSVDQLNADMLRYAVKYGNVSGSLSVREKGAIASLPTREKIEKFLAENA